MLRSAAFALALAATTALPVGGQVMTHEFPLVQLVGGTISFESRSDGRTRITAVSTLRMDAAEGTFATIPFRRWIASSYAAVDSAQNAIQPRDVWVSSIDSATILRFHAGRSADGIAMLVEMTRRRDAFTVELRANGGGAIAPMLIFADSSVLRTTELTANAIAAPPPAQAGVIPMEKRGLYGRTDRVFLMGSVGIITGFVSGVVAGKAAGCHRETVEDDCNQGPFTMGFALGGIGGSTVAGSWALEGGRCGKKRRILMTLLASSLGTAPGALFRGTLAVRATVMSAGQVAGESLVAYLCSPREADE
jgi:hypothetical protein